MIERGSRGAVARDHDHPHVVLEQQVDDLERILQDLVRGLGSIREPSGVAEVDDIGGGNEIEERSHDREAAEPAVEYADRPVVVHHEKLSGRSGAPETIGYG